MLRTKSVFVSLSLRASKASVVIHNVNYEFISMDCHANFLQKLTCNSKTKRRILLLLHLFYHFDFVDGVAVHSFHLIVAQLVLDFIPNNRQTPEQVKHIATDSYLV